MAQRIEETDDTTPSPTKAPGRTMRFEGTIELGGSVGGQMLNILFGQESDVDGKLLFEGAVQIDGTFRGAIMTDDVLIVGEHARIDADISCGSATVRGRVNGNITARDAVALETGARVKGDVTTPALSIERGATFDGASRMEPQSTTKARRPRS